MKRLKKLGIMLVIILILTGVSIIISMSKFNTPNFIKSGMGIAKIMLTDAEIVQIQQYPQVYLAKPDNAQQTLINFMEQRGYKYLEDERMASILVFGNETSKNYIEFSVNGYYSKWVFRE
ncbi:hypothetical protein [Defluviitalea saccharophila]|uniref:DUF4830 domain-containing protein n=1 Tax=Defluviitalea saccharophila TaxID=879970 RepID=A0ABZ2Y252_9FIRM